MQVSRVSHQKEKFKSSVKFWLKNQTLMGVEYTSKVFIFRASGVPKDMEESITAPSVCAVPPPNHLLQTWCSRHPGNSQESKRMAIDDKGNTAACAVVCSGAPAEPKTKNKFCSMSESHPLPSLCTEKLCFSCHAFKVKPLALVSALHPVNNSCVYLTTFY